MVKHKQGISLPYQNILNGYSLGNESTYSKIGAPVFIPEYKENMMGDFMMKAFLVLMLLLGIGLACTFAVAGEVSIGVVAFVGLIFLVGGGIIIAALTN